MLRTATVEDAAARDREPMWRRLVAEEGRVTVVAEDERPTGFLHVRLD